MIDSQKVSQISKKMYYWCMDKKTIIYVVVAVLVVGGLAAYVFTNKGQINFPGGEEVVEEGSGTSAVGEQTADGTSYVTEDGKVVNSDGSEVDLTVEPGSPNAPQQSALVTGDVPKDAIEIGISSTGITPNSFEVKSGKVVTLAVASTDTQTHLFKFTDPSMAAVAIGVGPGETRVITFNAPKDGTYDFVCDVPGHSGRGESGTMTVK
ncbi:MAG: hypothetical protein COT88_00805 [Candidatus Colwellbacteria bacterium CG10_big_fil_rev_8_21_14_0_10_41_28]|uniref:EfeO-type cupredoxin-like domain-containing protein n=1 Tax=Candidatus Colwellbacteria bacterium CG10_big_fil_rev_8_21_14_0_10_41_28 TaxID=1974539 RepID=A0A2H0VHG8_9BACT|nr:MAG: hypothetical protein COT88_00805 [Candidatus Colwellbacteria bacterium CG10_big_fil_rev_8_21_14_0_10_41_28]